MANLPATTDAPIETMVPATSNAPTSSGGGDYLSGFGQLDLFRQLGLMVGLMASVAIGFAVVLWSQGDRFQPVFGNMQGYDPNAIMEALDTDGVDYRIDPSSGVILVPADDIASIRLRLAAAGVTRFDGTGYELLDQDQALGTSQFMEANRIKRSQEGELQRTITNFRNVQAARVHIAIPERSVFVRSSQRPTASVFVTLNSGGGLNETQIDAIANLVASSVPELAPEDVTIVDQRGNLLSHQENNPGLEMADQQFQYTRKFEASLNDRVATILRPIVGFDGFQAQVTADIDFTHVEQAAESFDPESRVLVSEQTVSESSPTSDEVGGAPGALTNQPPENGVTAPPVGADQLNGGLIGNSRQQATRNYELGRQISYTNHDPVAINRISVAVVLDNKMSPDPEVEAQAWTADELAQLTTLVQDAVGFNEARGDRVTVINNSFARPEPMAVEEISLLQQPWLHSLIKQGLAGLFILLVVFGVLRPVLQNLAKTGTESRQLAVAATHGDFADLELAEQAMIDDDMKLTPAAEAALAAPTSGYDRQLNSVRGMVAQDPSRVAQVVKQWVAVDGE